MRQIMLYMSISWLAAHNNFNQQLVPYHVVPWSSWTTTIWKI